MKKTRNQLFVMIIVVVMLLYLILLTVVPILIVIYLVFYFYFTRFNLVGTIFGIYKKSAHSDEITSVKDLLKPGTELVAAGYALYDAATMIVLSTGLGVNGFTLDPMIGEFMLTHPDLKIPRSGKYYSINEGNSLNYDEPTKEWLAWNKKQKKALRYVGSMVGDVHRTLLYGGSFAYPGDSKNPKGKLRLIYELNPMSMIIEQAGGKSTTGRQRVLELKPTELHQKAPIFLGSWNDISKLEEIYSKYPEKADVPKAKL